MAARVRAPAQVVGPVLVEPAQVVVLRVVAARVARVLARAAAAAVKVVLL